MCPGNWWTSLTTCVSLLETAVPQTPYQFGYVHKQDDLGKDLKSVRYFQLSKTNPITSK